MSTHLLHRQMATSLPVIDRGEGIYFFDQNGKRYLDASGGAAVSCIGHNHPRVVEAIKAQLDKIAFAHTGFFTNQPAEQLADWLVERAPGSQAEHESGGEPGNGPENESDGFGFVGFVSGGSEANEAAMKFARQYFLEIGQPERCHFIARRQSYHGATLATLALGGHKARRKNYEPIIAGGEASVFHHIPPCFAYRYKEDDESLSDYATRCADALEQEILAIGPNKVAGFFAETIVGATAGVVPAAPGYFSKIRDICDKYGVLLILDEVMCGMGRCGTLFACETENIVPDIMTTAKGLGGGYQSIGAMLVKKKLGLALKEGSKILSHGHTYMAHATACAAALAVHQTIEEEGLLDNVQIQGRALMELLTERLGDHAHVGDIRGRGLFIGLELVQNKADKTPFDQTLKLSKALHHYGMENGLIYYPSSGTIDGFRGDHILLAPPFIIERSALTMLVDLLSKSLNQALDHIKR